MNELLDLPVRELVARIAEGKATAEAVVLGFLERVAAIDPAVEAWAYLNGQEAPHDARRLSTRTSALPLQGIPVGVKDIIDTADMPTAYGSALYEGFRPAADAACVALAREMGAVVLGKTVTAEFALSSPGRTRNPFNTAHTPGGSSGGSAAAVASGMVPLALGTQTGGSIIRPAAYCGVVGYKPSFGLIDRAGVKPLSQTLDTVGVFARSVEDAGFFAGLLAKRDLLENSTEGPVTVGLYSARGWSELGAGTRRALDEAAVAFRRAGARLVEIAEFPDEEPLRQAYDTIVRWEIRSSLAFERIRHLEQLRDLTREVLTLEPPSTQQYDTALTLAAAAGSHLEERFRECDVLLAPAVPDEAPAGILGSGDPVHCLMWSLLHVPCITIPVTRGPGGLPVGVQLVGRIRDDQRLMRVAIILERALCRSQR